MKIRNLNYKTIFFITLLFTNLTLAQVGINSDNSTPHPAAQLDVKSSNKGLLLPRITSPNTSIIAPTAGLMVYDQSKSNLAFYNGANWSNVNGTAANQGLYSQFPNSQSFSAINQYYDGGASNNYVEFNWPIPSGINRIWVEMWSAGSGAQFFGTTVGNPSNYFSGEGGGYMSCILDLTSLPSPLKINVGKGGAGANSSFPYRILGTKTTISDNVSTLLAEISTLNYYLFQNSKGLLSVILGELGELSTYYFQTYYSGGAPSTVTFYKGGNGGNAYLAKGGQGELVQTSPGTNTIVTYNGSGFGRDGVFPGGGGGVGFTNGGDGEGGLVIIHW